MTGAESEPATLAEPAATVERAADDKARASGEAAAPNPPQSGHSRGHRTPPYRIVPALVVLGLGALAAILLADVFYLSCSFVSRNYNEGWVALQTERALSGTGLYDTSGRFIATDYPPLFFYVVALFRAVTPDYLFAGRLAATIGFGALVLGVGAASWVAARDGLYAVLSALAFTLIMATFFHEYVAIADPQILAHAIAVPALILILIGATGRISLFVMALLLVLAGFMKHNLVALPLTITLYLLIYERSRLWLWLVYAVGLLAVGFALCLAIFGFGFIDGLLTPRMFTLERLGRTSTKYLVMLQLPIAFWALSLLFGRMDRKTVLIAIYIVISALTGIAFMGGDGTSFNVVFDLTIGLAVALGMGLARFDRSLTDLGQPRPKVRAILALASVALCGGELIATPAGVYRLVRDASSMSEVVAQTRSNIAYLQAQPGPVLCSSLDLCYWAGKGFEVDVFNSAQLTAAGQLDAEVLFNRIRQGAFSVIQLPRLTIDPTDNDFQRRLIEVAQRYYAVTRTNTNGVFLEYRGGDGGGPPP